MRSFGRLACVLTLVALAPQISAAQEGRPFKDSWFWGVKTGGMTYSGASSGTQTAPTIGADWLITRSNGGLYLSYDQGFLSQTEQVMFQTLGDSLPVTFKNTRRVDLAGVLFPSWQRWHTRPYVGLGASFMQVASAGYNSAIFGSDTERDAADEEVKKVRTNVAPVLMLGAQTQLRWFSVFAQASTISTRADYALKGTTSASFTYQIGLRYNIGSSIDKDLR